MSNISQASNELKKKLSFKDYEAPVEQQEATPVSQSVEGQMTVGQQASLDNKPASQPTSSSMTVRRQAGKKESQESSKKIKATFYLSEEDNQLLTNMFIKRLQDKNKTDKSALIVEAIHLLYKKEMR